MRRKIVSRIILGISVFVVAVIILTKGVAEPWIGKKIQDSFNKKYSNYQLKIEKVHVLFFNSGIGIKNITLLSKTENEGRPALTGEIESVKVKGIHVLKAVLRKNIHIREIDIFNNRFFGKFDFPEKTGPAKVSPFNISIENLFVENLFVDVKDTLTAQSYLIKDGVLNVYDINIGKNDTLSPNIFGQLDFDALEFKTVTPDSLYTFSVVDINYSAGTNKLTADSFAIQPNYSEYEFTGRNKFETDRVEGRFSQISFFDFSAADFIKSGNLTSSYIEIGELELNVFRDKRKEFRHAKKPTFQDLIANYPGTLNIDSIGIFSGNIIYSEHAEKAIEKGTVSFNEIDAKIYKITNDTIYKTEKAYFELKANAKLMGKGKVAVLLKARIFDNQNTFAVNGTLSEMDASELNAILENNASITITSGTINTMNFSFSANKIKATDNLKLLYQGLDFDVVNKHTGETTAIAEQIKSMIANIVVMESNPMPEEEVRPGIIEYDRDPERFLFNYVVKALTTGIKTSITKTKSSKKTKK